MLPSTEKPRANQPTPSWITTNVMSSPFRLHEAEKLPSGVIQVSCVVFVIEGDGEGGGVGICGGDGVSVSFLLEGDGGVSEGDGVRGGGVGKEGGEGVRGFGLIQQAIYTFFSIAVRKKAR